MKYDVEFWKKVLDDFNGIECIYLCGASNEFKLAWKDANFREKLVRLFDEWPEKLYSIHHSQLWLVYMPYCSTDEKRQVRIGFLKYLITNKIEIQV